MIDDHLPSGKHTAKTMERHHFDIVVKSTINWSFSIAV